MTGAPVAVANADSLLAETVRHRGEIARNKATASVVMTVVRAMTGAEEGIALTAIVNTTAVLVMTDRHQCLAFSRLWNPIRAPSRRWRR